MSVALQCRIIESVLNHCDWFFGSDLDDVIMMEDAFLNVAYTQTGSCIRSCCLSITQINS